MEYLKVGLITKPHGLKGEIKIIPLTDNPERFNDLKKVYLFYNNDYKSVTIQYIKNANNLIIIKLKNYNNREDAEKLRNIYMFINRDEGIPLDSGEYYTQDLVGCKFYYKDKLLGNVIDVINEGSCDIFIIKNKGNDVFYPFLADYIDKIDILNKKIDINYIEGYFD